MKNPILGYVVVSSEGAHLSESEGAGEKPVLWWGGEEVTLFRTRSAAQRILSRTIEYRDKNNIMWKWFDDARVVPVRGAI